MTIRLVPSTSVLNLWGSRRESATKTGLGDGRCSALFDPIAQDGWRVAGAIRICNANQQALVRRL